ncbi:ABC transporter ATP-binding protein [Micromonospora echinofusca]|uniref:ATP-binding cassette domain-containing protein n=1 Tax=Micromonospora echinofusca TaxID=47858 RepID=A0ABS3VK74_MICEH|nr:ABC transporter ATP-binding protein [Micromonospora echinofusca]MBO4204931.1 ATP-binding cassette domain-containing protein [Micromonospora echinofusca]
MLRIEKLSASYGEARVLRDVSLTVARGEVVTLVGRNGAGKSTLLRCVMGLHDSQRGTVELDGRDISRLPAHRRARLGLGWVPDDRGSYATLTVTEHLTLPPTVGPDPWSLDRIYEAFPALHTRRTSAATMLSGGEQQMLALARVLRMGARLLLCDEPTEGLSPLLVQQVGDILRQAKQHGVTVLLVEQNLHFATGVADRHYLLAEGEIVSALDNTEVHSRERELLSYLGI